MKVIIYNETVMLVEDTRDLDFDFIEVDPDDSQRLIRDHPSRLEQLNKIFTHVLLIHGIVVKPKSTQ